MNKHEQYRKLLTDARAIADLAAKEERDFTAEERQQIENLLKAAADLKKELEKAKADAELVKQIMDLNAEFEASPKPKQDPAKPGRAGRSASGSSRARSGSSGWNRSRRRGTSPRAREASTRHRWSSRACSRIS